MCFAGGGQPALKGKKISVNLVADTEINDASPPATVPALERPPIFHSPKWYIVFMHVRVCIQADVRILQENSCVTRGMNEWIVSSNTLFLEPRGWRCNGDDTIGGYTGNMCVERDDVSWWCLTWIVKVVVGYYLGGGVNWRVNYRECWCNIDSRLILKMYLCWYLG